ncbi:MAG TPA: hypothetical protein RMH99_05345 [Sandaracinaceae bacterium LLY-WYZ-13_1]|nr:hypothetical protein [Sandaracinaceae bacterium LLY-WYZ-13_1]
MTADGRVFCEQTHFALPPDRGRSCTVDGYAVRARLTHAWSREEGARAWLRAPLAVARVRDCGNQVIPLSRVPDALAAAVAPELVGTRGGAPPPDAVGEACRDEDLRWAIEGDVRVSRAGSVLRFAGDGSVELRDGERPLERWALGSMRIRDDCAAGGWTERDIALDVELVCAGGRVLVSGGTWRRPLPTSCAGDAETLGAGPGAPCVPDDTRTGHVWLRFSRALHRLGAWSARVVELRAPSLRAHF